jgi:hypothetical protein
MPASRLGSVQGGRVGGCDEAPLARAGGADPGLRAQPRAAAAAGAPPAPLRPLLPSPCCPLGSKQTCQEGAQLLGELQVAAHPRAPEAERYQGELRELAGAAAACIGRRGAARRRGRCGVSQVRRGQAKTQMGLLAQRARGHGSSARACQDHPRTA